MLAGLSNWPILRTPPRFCPDAGTAVDITISPAPTIARARRFSAISVPPYASTFGRSCGDWTGDGGSIAWARDGAPGQGADIGKVSTEPPGKGTSTAGIFRGPICRGIGRRWLFIEPDVLEAIAIVDAVDDSITSARGTKARGDPTSGDMTGEDDHPPPSSN